MKKVATFHLCTLYWLILHVYLTGAPFLPGTLKYTHNENQTKNIAVSSTRVYQP